MKLDFKKAFYLGFGFFGVMMVWTLYNSFVPILLKNFIASNALIGLIMTFDNILAVTIQPIIGAASDRTRSTLGRRMPYLLIGTPLAAVSLSFIPFVKLFWLFISVIVMMNVFMALFRTPLIALMPDVIPSAQRSSANGVINFMGGAGALIALFGGGILFDINRKIPFVAVGVVLVFSIILVFLRIKEPAAEVDSRESNDISIRMITVSFISVVIGICIFFFLRKTEILDGLLSGVFEDSLHGQLLLSILIFAVIVFIAVSRSVDKNALFIFLAIFCWFFSYNGMETFFTLFGQNSLHITPGRASMILGVFSLSFIVFAIPSGFAANRIGRKRTIILGIFVLMIAVLSIGFVGSIPIIIIVMVVGGIAWACININSYPMICDLATDDTLGTYTGLYYFFSMLAQTISPPVMGIAIDITGNYKTVFYIAPVFFALALILMMFVKGGEAERSRQQMD
jgi:maltose/moltooligosaccharide transporter